MGSIYMECNLIVENFWLQLKKIWTLWNELGISFGCVMDLLYGMIPRSTVLEAFTWSSSSWRI